MSQHLPCYSKITTLCRSICHTIERILLYGILPSTHEKLPQIDTAGAFYLKIFRKACGM